ncbi:MAG: A/G-specific adenine glycosylase [Eubacterium sp.]|nr:A/G-specific adenine glycosylase [Eubacterium sp.]
MLKDYPIRQLVRPLLEWYPDHARVLPWREQPEPYRVWVSEIMLQQTRVEAVKPYFERFMQALPDVAALADCPEERLLKLWEGLGYYNRARNMQAAARTVMQDYEGVLPADYEALLKLKGIGHYTAGAIASIAYGIPVPAVDGNVLRILMRVSEDDSDIGKQSVKSEAERLLWPVIPKDQAAMFTQATMELGATVCVPNGEPKCRECPWQPYCLAFRHGTYDRLPYKNKTKPRKIEEKTVLVIRDGEKVLLHRRPRQGLLAGMYEFPNLEGHLTREEVTRYVEGMELLPLKIEPLEEARHIFSHIEWQMTGYMIRVAQLDDLTEHKTGYVFAEAEVSEEKYAIPSAFARYTKYMNIRLGISKDKK